VRGSWSYRSMLLVAGCALTVGLWARINNLGSPSSRVFDETCFPTFVYNYLLGLPVFDLHPPLGKFVLAAVIALVGDTPLAWRLMSALFGCALLILGAGFRLVLREREGRGAAVGRFRRQRDDIGGLLSNGSSGWHPSVLHIGNLAYGYARRAEDPSYLAGLIAWSLRRRQMGGTRVGSAGGLCPLAQGAAQAVDGLWISVVVYVLVVYIGEITDGTRDPWLAWAGVWEWHRYAAGGIALQVDYP